MHDTTEDIETGGNVVWCSNYSELNRTVDSIYPLFIGLSVVPFN